MGINRRRFSLLLAGSLLAPGLRAQERQPLFASACTTGDGNHYLQLIDRDGGEWLRHPLPGRAHHVAAHPQQPWLAAIARRPGRFIDLVDYRQGQLLTRIEADDGRHFYGHAIFSRDGRYLISTENDVASGQGRVVLRDGAQQFAVVADHPSYGIGPHELALLANGRHLVIANGGILTDPRQGRAKLNLDSMQPSLAYIDLISGELLAQQFMPPGLHQLSIRHLDVNQRDQVIIALQYQGALHDEVPLVALHQPGQALQLLKAPAEINRAMQQYCGSARCDSSGRYAAVSAPRGDLITFWDLSDGRFLSATRCRDGCGLAALDAAGRFLISSGSGRCYRYDLAADRKQVQPLQLSQAMQWDNHMIAL